MNHIDKMILVGITASLFCAGLLYFITEIVKG